MPSSIVVRLPEFARREFQRAGRLRDRPRPNLAQSVNGSAATVGSSAGATAIGTSRTVADGVTTNNSQTVTSATASFVSSDLGAAISGTNIPAGTVITAVGSSTSVTISNVASASGTSLSLTIVKPSNTYSPLTGGGGASSTPDTTAPFRYIGVGPESVYLARYGSTFPQYNYVISTHKTASNTVSPTHLVSFHVAGSAGIEIKLATQSGGGFYRLRVDGQLVTLLAQSFATVGQTWLPVTLPDAEPHLVTIELYQTAFGGVVTGPQGVVWKPAPPTEVNCLVIGDSFVSGTGSTNQVGGWARAFGDAMGWNIIESGVGGTGYVNPGVSPNVKFLDRAANDFHGVKAEIVLVTGGHNDLGYASTSAVQSAAAALAASLRAEYPNAPIIVVGPWGLNNSQYSDLQTAIFAGWNGYADLLIDTCAQPWFTGTGYAGALTGLGNCDALIGSDGVHPNDLGHRYLARRMAETVSRWLDDLTLPATSVAASLRPLSTTTTLAVSGSQVQGKPQKLVAQVSPPRPGTVTFYDGATALATLAVPDSGVVTYYTATLASGSRSLTATFNPRSTVRAAASTSSAVSWNMLAALTTPITSGLVQWFSVAALSALADNAAVSDWAPSGGSEATHLVQATGGTQPTYKATDMNGHPAVLFGSSGKGMDSAAAYGTPVGATCTIFLLHKEGAGTGSTQWPVSGSYNGGSSTLRAQVGVTSAGLHCFQMGSASVQTPGAPSIPGSTSPHVTAALFNGSSSYLWSNQNTKPTEIRTFSTTALDGLQGLRLGASLSGGAAYTTFPFTGEISEVLVYNRVLTDDEVKQTLNYLADAYGVTLGA